MTLKLVTLVYKTAAQRVDAVGAGMSFIALGMTFTYPCIFSNSLGLNISRIINGSSQWLWYHFIRFPQALVSERQASRTSASAAAPFQN